MAHTYNRAAFKLCASSGNLLLSLYGALVALELRLKDHDSSHFKRGHDLPSMLGTLNLSSRQRQLENYLVGLTCTLVEKGSPQSGPVRARQYPDLRYLRHERDYPGLTTDEQLQEGLSLARDINLELDALGVG